MTELFLQIACAMAAAASEAVACALARSRCKPDVAYVFATTYFETGDMAALHAAIKGKLGPDVQICGCTGHAIVGTDGGAAKDPVLLEDSTAALSISLVYFAGQCEAAVTYLSDDTAVVPEQPPCDEKQIVFLTVPPSAGYVPTQPGLNMRCL